MSIAYDAIPILTDGAGAATVYSTKPMDGELVMLRVTIGTLAAGAVDLTITDNASGVALLTISNLAASTDYYPRGAAVNPANSAITNSFVKIPVTGSIKCVVAQGGAAATGTLHTWVKR
jgi:hypothetical protein